MCLVVMAVRVTDQGMCDKQSIDLSIETREQRVLSLVLCHTSFLQAVFQNLPDVYSFAIFFIIIIIYYSLQGEKVGNEKVARVNAALVFKSMST